MTYKRIGCMSTMFLFGIFICFSQNTIFEPIAVFRHDSDNYYKIVEETIFSSDGEYIALAGSNGVSLYSVMSELLLKKLETYQTACMDFSSESRMLFTGVWNGEIIIWNVQTGEKIKEFTAHKGNPTDAEHLINATLAIDVSSDDKWVISRGNDLRVKVWNAHTWEEIYSIPYSQNSDVIFLPSNHEFMIGPSIFRFEDGQLLRTLPIEDGFVKLKATKDGRYLFTSLDDQSIVMWDLSTFEQIKAFDIKKVYQSFSVNSMDVSPNGQYLIAGHPRVEQKTIIWEIESGRVVYRQEINAGGAYSVNPVRFSPDGTKFITGGPDATVLLWDLNEVINAQSSVDYFENYEE